MAASTPPPSRCASRPVEKSRKDQAENAAPYARQRAFFVHFERQVPNGRIGRASLRAQPDGRRVEKGVDVGVALDLAMGAVADRWDTGIVVSGDGDLARAGEVVRYLGKRFEVVACERGLSGLLRAQADRVTILRGPDFERLRRRTR
jgi:uncharacterized LabA/DUF88 family protein